MQKVVSLQNTTECQNWDLSPLDFHREIKQKSLTNIYNQIQSIYFRNGKLVSIEIQDNDNVIGLQPLTEVRKGCCQH